MVERLLGKCLRKRAEFIPGHVVEKTEVIAVVQVDTTGMKSNRWRYWTMSDLVEIAWTLLDNRECGGMGDTVDTGYGLAYFRSM